MNWFKKTEDTIPEWKKELLVVNEKAEPIYLYERHARVIASDSYSTSTEAGLAMTILELIEELGKRQ